MKPQPTSSIPIGIPKATFIFDKVNNMKSVLDSRKPNKNNSQLRMDMIAERRASGGPSQQS
jgi:hypothetical protein